MKKCALMLTGLMLTGRIIGIGAEDPKPGPDQTIDKKNEHILDAMTQLLALTKDQQASVKAALEDQSTQLTTAQKEFLDLQKKIQDGTDAKIKTFLSDNQKAKYPDVKAQLQKEEEQKLVENKKGPKNDSKDNKGNGSPEGGHHHHHQGGGSGSPSGNPTPF